MRYTDLIFDLYGTLVDIHTDENALVWEKTALYFSFHGAHYTPEELQIAFQKAMAAREVKAGQSYECFPDIPFEEVMAELFEQKGVQNGAMILGVNAAQVFRITSIAYIKLYPGVTEALTFLREKGCKLWLLSNAQAIFTAPEILHVGLKAYLDGIYLSSDFGCRKPDKRFYDALLSGQKLDAKRCLMIGNDRETDIAGAKGAGMDTLYMHTNLTPDTQKPADPAKRPGVYGGPDYEFEGEDWLTLSRLIAAL